jgi:hypothetical protein
MKVSVVNLDSRLRGKDGRGFGDAAGHWTGFRMRGNDEAVHQTY